MLKHLKDLKKYHELDVFTTLPHNLMDKLLKAIPGLDSILDFVLCQEDATPVEDFIIKDISILLGNRELEDIFVIDPHADHGQEECVASVAPHPYVGLITYK